MEIQKEKRVRRERVAECWKNSTLSRAPLHGRRDNVLSRRPLPLRVESLYHLQVLLQNRQRTLPTLGSWPELASFWNSSTVSR